MGIIALDVGTSSMRGVLYDDKGRRLFTEQVLYSPEYLRSDWVEQNPQDWKNAMENTIKSCTTQAYMSREEIKAISMTSQRSSVIPMGADDRPLGNAIMWHDKRSLGVLEALSSHNDMIFKLSGSRLNPVFSGPKMLWLRKCMPELYEKAQRLVVIPDYLVHEMTGEWQTDATYASRSLLMNLRSQNWDEELLRLFQVDKEKLLRIVKPGSVIGRIRGDFAARTGLLKGTPVISAGGDQQCAALGMGVIEPGVMEVSAGTGTYIIAASKEVPKDMRGDVICNASAIPGEYVLESSILTGASVFNWCLRLCYGMDDGNQRRVYQTVNEEMERSLQTESDLVMFPFFQGRGTPDWNSRARGCIYNMDLGTGRGDIARAALEGLCYEISANIDVIRNYVGEVKRIFICGGLVNSPPFCKILSGTCENTICTYSDNEAAAMGAWISAAVTLGIYPDYTAAFCQIRSGQPVMVTKAEEAIRRCYSGKKKDYQSLYERIYK